MRCVSLRIVASNIHRPGSTASLSLVVLVQTNSRLLLRYFDNRLTCAHLLGHTRVSIDMALDRNRGSSSRRLGASPICTLSCPHDLSSRGLMCALRCSGRTWGYGEHNKKMM